MKTKYMAALAAAILAPFAMAQDITTEISVDRTIVPEQRSAERPALFVPSVSLPQVELTPLSLHEYLKASELTTILPVLEPAGYADTIAVSPYRGYAALGYFPVYNLGASAGYRFISNHNTRLGAWLQFDGNSYKGRDASDGLTFSNNTLNIGADFNRMFKAGHLAVGAEYMYGRTGIPTEGDGYHRNVSQVKTDAAWWGRAFGIAYHAGFEFEHFGFHNYFGEQRYTAEMGAIIGNNGKPGGGIELKGDFLSCGNGLVTAEPYYTYRNEKFLAHVGLKLDIATGTRPNVMDYSPSRFHVAPDVTVAWTPSGFFAMEARVTGGSRLNTAAGYYDYCYYMTPQEMLPYSNVPVDAMLSIAGGPVAGVSLRLFGGYSMADDWLMPSGIKLGTQAPLAVNLFAPVDLRGWLAGVGVGYRWRDMVEFEATAQMAPRQSDRGYYRWLDRARYVVDANVKVTPTDRLDIEAGYEFRGGRTTYVGPQPLSLGNKSSLNLGAAYRVDDRLSVWLRGENLLGHRYDLLVGLPSQGIKGLAGVSYKF
ncbi:MAG: hypothetical protein K2G24_01365 [Muribaculaceae bacterium]|nr:hypothetical protein [Muribaculaceae bacterium]